MIPQSFIQELLSRVDIVDVVGRYVQLKKAGANYSGLCPFHAEKSPSFTVAPTKQFYHCFGCGANGTAIGFLIEHLGLSFPDAVADLAQSVGLTVPHEPGRGGDTTPSASRDPDLLELMTRITQFYKRRLKDTPRAIDYLKRRGLSGETAARYGIGYAPDAWRGLEAAVPDYDAPALLTTGMVIEHDGASGHAPANGRGGSGGPVGTAGAPGAAGATGTAGATGGAGAASADGVTGADGTIGQADAAPPPAAMTRRRRFDRFRDRIMFPIRNPRGQIIGFGGRVLDKGEPKYMNSPETPLFSKGHELYGLYEARDAMRQTDCAIVVEGYMDVVMLAQHGVRNAVATLGTATTADHVRKLLRQVERVVFAFDGDKAGRKAAWRALEACLPMVADTKRLEFLFLPPEHDPDSYVREHGADGFGRLLDGAESLSALLLRELTSRVDLEQAEGRAHFLAEARPLLLAMPQAALRMQLVHRVAEYARIGTGELNDYLRQGAAAARDRADQRAGAGRFAPAGGHRSSAGDSAYGRGREGHPAEESGHPAPLDDRWAHDEGWAHADPGGQGDAAERFTGGWGGGAQGGWLGSRDGSGQGGGWFKGRGDGRSGGGRGADGWRGGGNRQGRPWDAARGGRYGGAPPPRVPIQPPALISRVCLLAALHPTLALDPLDEGFLPEALTGWLALLRTLPAGASFAVVCESLREQAPDMVRLLERQAGAPRQIVVDMGLEDARKEFDGALRQLRQRGLREAIDALVGGGLASAEDRQRLQELQALRIKT